MAPFDGKVALVTGAKSGIGYATAKRFVELGAKVMFCGRTLEPLQAAAREFGDNARATVCDVRVSDQVKAAVDATVEAFGGLDILYNNAGILITGSVSEMDEQAAEDIIATNLLGSIYGMKHAVPAIAARGGGSIINSSSIAAMGGIPFFSVYCASKTGISNLTRAAALELRPQNIRVNAVAPGFTQTDMMDDLRATVEEMIPTTLDEDVPVRQGRWIHPDEVAAIVTHLASDEAAMVSGTIYSIDNGIAAGVM
jgi:NAD(P)-dependent dehydrogenase (short-subunit alcohol dehydrogenase family)